MSENKTDWFMVFSGIFITLVMVALIVMIGVLRENNRYILTTTEYRTLAGERGSCVWKTDKRTGSTTLESGNSLYCKGY